MKTVSLAARNPDELAKFDKTTFVYDPDRPEFLANRCRAAFSYRNGDNSTVYFGRAVLDYADPTRSAVYGTVFLRKGGDTGLLFIGLHEYGHLVQRRVDPTLSFQPEIEGWANNFAGENYPKALGGYDVDPRYIHFKGQ